MLKMLHMTLVLLSLVSFLGRVYLVEKKPEMMQLKWVNIAPHILNGFLLLSGFALVFSGGWLAGNYGWIIAKLIALMGYIGFGILFIKRPQDPNRWFILTGALLCFAYMGKVAVSKTALLFF